ncbi:hypothetical protein [Hydrogenophaga sp. 2FB]|uniref:hypothetical protein n=1 Tax=Hydrogenophaga sp. 2FB TaxID=2502187 RepID=UPI0010F832CB|nr:hypothetical protein [Hydrogenophaga sp. 2FB]
MRQFEIDDIAKAAAGDASAQLRVQRRKDILNLISQQRKDAQQRATPSWANQKAIDEIYAQAREITASTGTLHVVDHVVPLQGRKVCGLHVEHNLRVMTKAGNSSKGAKFDDWGSASRNSK